MTGFRIRQSPVSACALPAPQFAMVALRRRRGGFLALPCSLGFRLAASRTAGARLRPFQKRGVWKWFAPTFFHIRTPLESTQTKRLLWQRSCPQSGLRIALPARSLRKLLRETAQAMTGDCPRCSGQPVRLRNPVAAHPLAPSRRGKGNVIERDCAPSPPLLPAIPRQRLRAAPLSRRGCSGAVHPSVFPPKMRACAGQGPASEGSRGARERMARRPHGADGIHAGKACGVWRGKREQLGWARPDKPEHPARAFCFFF